MSKAKARAITASEYRTFLQAIRDGAVSGSTTTTTIAPGAAEKVAAPGKPAGAATRSIIGGIAGLMLGVGLVLLLDRFDGRLRRRDDVEAATRFVVVAEIPPLPRKESRSTHLQAFDSPGHAARGVPSRAAQRVRLVRWARAGDGGEPAAVLMVTSAGRARARR